MKFPFRIVIFFLFLASSLSHPQRSYQQQSSQYPVSTEYRGKDLGFSVKCSSCTMAIFVTAQALKIDFTETLVIKLATIICYFFAKQSYAICDGISTQFRDEFFYVFRQIAHRSPSEICGILIPDCANELDPSGSSWEVLLPPKPKKNRRRISRKDLSPRPLRVLQLSDLHIDIEYQPGSEAKCGDPVCCRASPNVPVVPTTPAGYWGTVAPCDIPLRTFDHMLQSIKEQNMEIDYIMLTGDYINHVDWKYSKEEHLDVLRKIGAVIRERFPTTPTYWAVGNHEGVPVNSFAPHTVDEKFWPTWLYSELANLSKPWIGDEANKTMHYRGSYAVKVMDGLKLISLNTGFCESTNFFLYINQSDPDATMTWLVSELVESEKAGEKVHLMAHIPPGDGECLEGWARNYYRVIQRFSSTISAQFFGHVHTDYFTVFYKDMNNISSLPVGVGYAAPSATTFANLNPGFRIYDVSLDGKYEILEIENYFANLTSANSTHPPEWKLLYKAKEDLQLPDLSPQSWETLIRRLEKDDDLFDKFVGYSYRTDDKNCGLNCRRAILCAMRSGHHNETLYCPSSATKKDSSLQTNRVDF